MNSKTLQGHRPRNMAPSNFLPKKNNNSKRAKPARKSNGNGPRAPRLQRDEVIERGIPGYRTLTYRAKLNYYDIVSVTSGAASAGNYVYSCNGMYDPDITSTGHQPMPFDQLMLSFEHYVVMSAVITVNFRNTSDASTLCCAIGVHAAAAPTTNIIALVENGELVRDRLMPYPNTLATKALRMPMSVAKFGNVRQLQDNPSYQGSVGANPVEQSYFHLSVWNPDSATAVAAICEVFIQYTATFFEPRQNSASVNAALKQLILAEECGGSATASCTDSKMCARTPAPEQGGFRRRL